MKKNILITVFISIITSVLVFVMMGQIAEKLSEKESVIVDFNEDYTMMAGVIRNEGKGWKLIQDEAHETLGIKSVSSDEEKIIISYDKTSKVNSMSVSVDETMAAEGFTVGASVGLDVTYIFVYDANGDVVQPKKYVNSKGNIWIQGIFKK